MSDSDTEFEPVDRESWRERVETELKGAGLESLIVETLEGVVLAPLYADTPADSVAYPGLPPYTRGPSPLPSSPPWRRAQLVQEPDLDAATEQIRADRAGGVNMLWLRLGGPARFGGEPAVDAAPARRGILALDAADLEQLVRAAEGSKLALRLDAGANALPVAAGLSAALERAGYERGSVRVHLGMDPLAALATDGRIPGSADRTARECGMLVARCARSIPGARALGVSTVSYARAGADGTSQLAYALATAVQYLRWAETHGVEPEVTAAQLDFVLETDRHLLLEVARIRALRYLWSRLQRACGIEPSPAWIHVSSGWRTLTRRDPWTNVLRTTVQCAAAIFGGADAITTLPWDAPLAGTSESARRLARNTQAILAEESGLGRTLDPGGGAYALETLTRQIAAVAWERFQDLEAAGGMLACLQNGQIHDAVMEDARRRAERIHADDRPVLGVSVYPTGEPEPAPTARDATEVMETARARLAGRREKSPAPPLDPLEAAAYEPDDAARLGDALMTAAREGATFAELSAALRPGATPLEIAPLAARSDEDLVAALAEEPAR